MEYRAFLEAKVCLAAAIGASLGDDEVNPILKPHQRAIVRWSVQGERRACFAAFGLGKTLIEIEFVRIAAARADGMGLIVLPLGVRQEFMHDAELLRTGNHPEVTDAQRAELAAWLLGRTERAPALKFIRSAQECHDPRGIYITNYETVRDGKLDTGLFAAVSLDEAAILRGFGGTKTFREFMATMAGDDRRDVSNRIRGDGIRFRLVATATPSPNEYIELLAYAAFLDVMDVGQAKTRFFKRNSEKADKLTLHPHKEAEFWLWVASWALFVQKPSDIDPEFSDEGYELPPLDVRWHEVPTNHATAGTEKDGQNRLFRNASLGVQDAAREKRESLSARIDAMMGILSDGDDEGIFPRLLPQEPRGDKRQEQGVIPAQQGTEEAARGAVARAEHGARESAAKKAFGEESRQDHGAKQSLVRGEQETCVGDGAAEQAGEARPIDGAVRCATAFDSGLSDLRAAADSGNAEQTGAGGRPLPRDRQVPGDSVQGVQLGARADHGEPGSVPACGGISGNQFIVWCDLNDEQRAIEHALSSQGVSFASLAGAQDIETRECLMQAWRNCELVAFVSKPVMYGSGVNLQQCNRSIFLGIGFKFAEFCQALHRTHRFGQTRPVRIDLIYTEAEREVRKGLERKWEQHKIMVGKMTQIIREYGLAHAASAAVLARSIGVQRVVASGKAYTIINNDCVEELRAQPGDSVDLIVTSIPFATQYEYSPSYNDFGHTDTNAHFWQQMDFLTPNLLRVLRPGRVAAIHVKDRICPGGVSGFGFQTVQPFSDECVAHFQKHGFAFLARKTIVTDVVRENNQTYRLGWSEQCKDGSRMGAGMPEYLLLFRKPPTDRSNGYADVPVVKDKETYTRPWWQFDAHGFTRSDGNRPLMPEELEGLPQDAIFQLFKKHSLENVYNFRHDVKIAEAVDTTGWLPSTFMLLQPQSWHPDVWTDITRMRTLNSSQVQRGAEMHLCPLQFDIVDRCIEQYTMPGETVLDPFAGLGTVPYCAVKLKRRGIGIELNGRYFLDAATYCKAAEEQQAMPDFFEALEVAA